jgi:SAM-dependent methyltransferase
MNFRVLRDVINRYPPLNWLIYYLAEVTYLEYRDVRGYIKGRLVDIGCGEKPCKVIWAPVVSEHVGVDHEDTCHDRSNIDIFSSAYNIPVESESFDSAICNAVLEHLEEPELAIRECYRILKPNGIAIYSVPFIWHLHEEPRDFYRFSKYGLTYLFKKVGFRILELKALSGFWITFGQLFVYNLYRLNLGPLKWFRLIDIAGVLIQLAAYLLDKMDRTEQWTWMNIIVVEKPQDPK